jgi:hypothetical protein
VFEAAPEAFHGGVVVAVARSAHAGNDARHCQSLVLSAKIHLNHVSTALQANDRHVASNLLPFGKSGRH